MIKLDELKKSVHEESQYESNGQDILDLVTALELAIDSLQYISMPHNEFKDKEPNDVQAQMSELANQRLFDMSEASQALFEISKLVK